MTRTRAAGVFAVLTLTAAALSACGGVEPARLAPGAASGPDAGSADVRFDDGVAQSLSDPAAVPNFEFKDSMDGINLIDGMNGRRFAPARDRFNHCICDRDFSDVTLSRNRPLTLSATFGAPPPGVRAVDVVIPRFGTIPDVQLG